MILKWFECQTIYGRFLVGLDLIGLLGMMRYSCADYFGFGDRAPVPFVGAKGTKSALVKSALSGPVLRVPDAENLKIRPEFLPV